MTSPSVKKEEKAELARTVHDLLTLFLITQSRTTNIPLFFIFEIQVQLLSVIDLSPLDLSITSLLFQQLSFFAFGGSNSLSSIDLSNAYNGVAGYNVVVVGLLTALSNWAGPIYWSFATNLLLLPLLYRRQSSPPSSSSSSTAVVGGNNNKKKKNLDRPFWVLLFNHLALLSAFVALALVAVMAACTALRTHLFIWSVFSPKYLYAIAWTLGHHLLINLLLGGCGCLLIYTLP